MKNCSQKLITISKKKGITYHAVPGNFKEFMVLIM
jgi:hypothetical protein